MATASLDDLERAPRALLKFLRTTIVGGLVFLVPISIAGLILGETRAVCFVAGLIARSGLATRIVDALESGFLPSIPGYAFIKGLTEGLAGDEGEQPLTSVLARFDDARQIAFRVEPVAPTMAAAVRNIGAAGPGASESLSPRNS